MNLKNLSDQELLLRTDDLARRERELLNQVLHHLREIERRRLFSDLGYKSLFDYAVKRLGYSDDQAARRISAMRLLKELPELESKIASGALTLTNIGMAQTLFRQEQKVKSFTREQKIELLEKIQNKSKREAEKIIVAKASEPLQMRPEQIRSVTESVSEVRFMANLELLEKLEKVKGLLAHKNTDLNLASTIEALCDLAIEKLDPAEKAKMKAVGNTAKSAKADGGRSKPACAPAPALKRRISISQRCEVWRKAESRCQICGSEHALQVDHIKPVALGGSDEFENLRLLCRSCNQRSAIAAFGVNRMQKYLET